jgi:hypothetical protein
MFSAVAAMLLIVASSALAAPSTLWQLPEAGPANGSGAGEVNDPRGTAVDPSTGNLWVVDRGNARIDEFSPWGEFIKAFGWGVNASVPSEELQVCTSASGCRAGTVGGATGQLNDPVAIAVDSDNVYVAEEGTHRVQIFGQDGTFKSMIGGKVNKTKVESAAPSAEQNRCPVDPGDVCQGGQAGTGSGEFSNSAFHGSLPGSSFRPTNFIAIGPNDTLYVGDVSRIEKFTAAGVPLGQLSGGALAGQAVSSLAIDGAGNIFASLRTEGSSGASLYSLLKLGPAGEVLHTYPVAEKALVSALALGRQGELYVVLDPNNLGASEEIRLEPRVVEFDAAGEKLLPTKEEVEAEEEDPPGEPRPFAQVLLSPNETFISGLATSSACGLEADDIFASYSGTPGVDPSLIRGYGPNPNPALCPPPEAPPTISAQFAGSVGAQQASVVAKINPHFWPSTTYYVEYGLGKCSEGGCGDVQPVPPHGLDSAPNLPVQTAPVALQGLAPQTTYHYRFVATTRYEGASEQEVVVKGLGGEPGLDGSEGTFTTSAPALPARTDCANQQFRTGLSALLPECRAYEMVSPIDKAGADVVAVNTLVSEIPARLDQSAASGDGFTYSAYRAFANSIAAPFSSQFLSQRSDEGWTTESISPGRGKAIQSVVETGDTEYQVFSADLCQGWLRLGFHAEPRLDPAELRQFPNLFQRTNCGSGSAAYKALTTVEPPNFQESERNRFSPQVQGISDDGRCTVFRAPDTLTPDAPLRPNVEKENILYESCGGILRLIAILPDGTPSQSSSTAGVGNNLETLSVFYANRSAGTYRAVSRDGRSIYWTASGEDPGKLYLRIHADQPQSSVTAGECDEPAKACTLPVSELVSSGAARFWTASADGRYAFFSMGGLLYEYNATDPAEPETHVVASGVERFGMLGASEDASRLYFVSTAILAPGASNGKANLYFLERGEAPRFIGILSPQDIEAANVESTAINKEPGYRAARVSANGLFAAFMSSAPLTGFDNTDQRNGEADREVFVYDAAAEGGEGHLVCVSCDPGISPLGRDIRNNESRVPVWAVARIPTWPSALYPSNTLVVDGTEPRLFFDSFVPLTPRDTNEKADVYEWRGAKNKAACEMDGAERYVPSMAGCLSLISSGTSDQDSEFIDADPSGRNVFFATGQSLLPQDPGLIDIYDAREGGGFPPVQASQPCDGEACQPSTAAPSTPNPASGAPREGNAKRPFKCPKGKRKVKRKGGRTACVKKKAKHAKHHKKSHGHKKHHEPSKKGRHHGAHGHKGGSGR